MRICQPPENSSVRRCQSACAKAQAGQNGADLRLDGVAVARAKLTFELMEAVGHLRVFGAGGIELRHLARQLLHLAFHVA